METMTKNSTEKKKHVAVFVFPFASHPLSLFKLVLKLADAAPHLLFSFIGTQQSNQPLLSKPHIPNNIKFYSVSDGVPEGEILSGHPVERLNLFLQAGPQNLQKGIDLAVEETKHSVTCIIADAFVTPSLIVAQNLNVPWISIWTSLSCPLVAHFHTQLIRDQFSNDTAGDNNRPLDFIPGFSKIRVQDLPEDILLKGGEAEETLFSKTLASMGEVLPQAKALAITSIEELDPPLLFEDMRSSKLLPCLLRIGFLSLSLPLPPLPFSDTDETGCLSWLDMQSTRSAVYVSFGTIVSLPPHELVAMAEALEESGFPFLWSLKDNLKGFLPNGFLERTSTVGKVVPWAPQIHVLGHDSVGVFVTHCGANSVFESISIGVPMICRPVFGDQKINGRMVEDIWENGVRIEGGVFTKNGLMKSLNLMLVQEEGKKMRGNALRLKTTVQDAAGPQGKAARDFNTLVEIVSSS